MLVFMYFFFSKWTCKAARLIQAGHGISEHLPRAGTALALRPPPIFSLSFLKRFYLFVYSFIHYGLHWVFVAAQAFSSCGE